MPVSVPVRDRPLPGTRNQIQAERRPCHDRREGCDGDRVRAVGDRHDQAAPGPDVRRLPRRQGQLSRRPGGRPAGSARLAGSPRHRAGQPGVPAAGGAVPGRRGGDTAVHRHRHRHPLGRERARGRRAGRAGCPGGLRGQRPDRARARQRAADRQRHHQHRAGRPARPEGHPGAPEAARADRLHPAGRPAAGRDLALHHRRGGPGRDRRHAAGRAPGGQLSRPVARDRGFPPAGH